MATALESERDTNLLLAILALQLRMVSDQELVAAGAVWVSHPQLSLGDILQKNGALQPEQHQAILQLIKVQQEASGVSVSELYELYGGDSSAQLTFSGSLTINPSDGSISYTPLIIGNARGKAESVGGLGSVGTFLTPEQKDRYIMRGVQGQGGIGRVLVVFDEQFQREVALKELLPDDPVSLRQAASCQRRSLDRQVRFLREACITGQLEHPGIVPVYELGTKQDGSLFYTMKLVRGVTLAAKLKVCRNISDRMALLLHFLDLSQAIAYAHERGVIHRDIKPANVMVGKFGETVLLDWGMAKVRGDKDERAAQLAEKVRLTKKEIPLQTAEGRAIGTPNYMSPEQADGRIEDIDERSDIWCLGAVLYELLTGKPPFRGSSALEVIGKVLTDDVEPVNLVCPEAPKELAAVTTCCLQRDPAQRYQSVQELVEDLKAFTSGGIVNAYTYSTGKMLQRWIKQRRLVVVPVVVALLAVLVALPLLLSKNAELQRREQVLLNQNLQLVVEGLVSKSKEMDVQYGAFQKAVLLTLQAHKLQEEHDLIDTANVATELRRLAATIDIGSTPLRGKYIGPPVAYSQNGKYVAARSDNSGIAVWETAALSDEPTMLNVDRNVVRSLVFSPDNSLLIVAGQGANIGVWQVADFSSQPRTFSWHKGGHTAIACSPDGKLLASGGYDKTIQIHRIAKLDDDPQILHFQQPDTETFIVESLEFCPNSEILISRTWGNGLAVWDLKEDNPIPTQLTSDEKPVNGSDYDLNRDGSILAVPDYQSNVLLFQLDNLDALPQKLPMSGMSGPLAFNAEGTVLAAVYQSKNIMLFNTDLYQEGAFNVVCCPGEVVDLEFSADGSLLAAADRDATIRVWRTAELWCDPLVLRGQEGIAGGLRFSPDGRLLFSSSWQDNSVRAWHITDSVREPIVLEDERIKFARSIVFDPGGDTLVSSGSNVILKWNLHRPQEQPLAVPSPNYDFTFNPINGLIASSGAGAIHIWDSRELLGKARVLQWHEGQINDVAFTPDGELLVTTGIDGRTLFQSLDELDQPPIELIKQENAAWKISLSLNSKWLAINGEESVVLVWNLQNLQLPPRKLLASSGHVDEYHLAFSPNGQVLLNSSFQCLDLWNLESEDDNSHLYRIINEGIITCLTFSPDGQKLAYSDGEGRVFMSPVVALDESTEEFNTHQGAVNDIAFSSDGQYFASAGEDGAIFLWQLEETHRKPQRLFADGLSVEHIEFSPDERQLASISEDGTIRIWQCNHDDVAKRLASECSRNLSFSEWTEYLGSGMKYESTIPWCPPGRGVPEFEQGGLPVSE